MMSDKAPYISEPTDQSQGRPATFIFLHGYADDAEGLPLALAQQFQFNNKLPYLRWLLPTAPKHPEVYERAWYTVKALPNASKPRVPGHEEDEQAPDDEEGIMASVGVVDDLVQSELDRGVDPERIVVGGFSQGCAVSLVWGVTGKLRNKVAGVVPLSGYFPLSTRIEELRKERGIPADEKGSKKWFYAHVTRDVLLPGRLFEHGKTELKKWVNSEDVEDHMYEGMAHSTCNPELRDMLAFLNKVVPP